MKLFVICAILLPIVSCSAIGLANTGTSSVSRSDDGLGNYAFNYDEEHATGGTFRKEKGGPGVQVGSYGLRDIDGRVRVVNYVADALGFRASVTSNEPGTDVKQVPAAIANVVPAVPTPVVAQALTAAPALMTRTIAGPVATVSGPGPLVSYAAPGTVVTRTLAAPLIEQQPWINTYNSPALLTKSQTFGASTIAAGIPAPIAASYQVQNRLTSVAAPVAYSSPIAVAGPAYQTVARPAYQTVAGPAYQAVAGPAYQAVAPIAVAGPTASSYSVQTQHLTSAPVAQAIAAPLAVPTLTQQTLLSPVIAAKSLAYATGPTTAILSPTLPAKTYTLAAAAAAGIPYGLTTRTFGVAAPIASGYGVYSAAPAVKFASPYVHGKAYHSFMA